MTDFADLNDLLDSLNIELEQRRELVAFVHYLELRAYNEGFSRCQEYLAQADAVSNTYV